MDGAQVHMHKYLYPGWAQVNHENGNGLDKGARIFVELKEPTESSVELSDCGNREFDRPDLGFGRFH